MIKITTNYFDVTRTTSSQSPNVDNSFLIATKQELYNKLGIYLDDYDEVPDITLYCGKNISITL